MEVVNLGQNVTIALLEGDLHDIDSVVALESSRVLTLEHLLSWVVSLGHSCDLIEWNNHGRLRREIFECKIVFVDEETMTVQHDVSLHQVVVLVDKLADWAFKDNCVESVFVRFFTLVFLVHLLLDGSHFCNLLLGYLDIRDEWKHLRQVVLAKILVC